LLKIKVNYYSDLGIEGSDVSSFSSMISKTDELENFSLDIIVNEILVIMNNVASIAVALVKKLLADLDDIKLSWETPNPKAPPSDFCKSTTRTKSIAKITLIIKTRFSITVIYSNFLTKATAIIATLFIITSISLTIMSKEKFSSTSVLENTEEEKEVSSEPEIPKSDWYFTFISS